MEKAKKKMKLWKKLLIIFISVILALGLILTGAIAYFRLSVKSYYDASEYAFLIPGLSDGAIPQGFDYDETSGNFLVSAYMKDGSPSTLYLVEKESGKTTKNVTFLTDKGKDYTGHFGGVGVYHDFVYVADGTNILVYSYQAILNAENNAKIPCLGKISTKFSDDDYVKNSFVTVYGDTLIVGEFYNGTNYTTIESHHITTKSGEKNCAIALEYDLNDSYTFGVAPAPKKAYSLPDKVQGLCINDGKIYLSTSYGLAFSHIYEHDTIMLTQEDNATFLGISLPVYSLTSESLVKDYKIAPMSEEIVIVDNELYVMCESASTKYIFGNFIGAKWCHKTDLSKMK